MPDTGRDTGRAWTPGTDPKSLARALNAAHDRFVDTGLVAGGIRPLVAKSWMRSVAGGVDPEESLAPLELVDGELDEWRRHHPLAPVMPVIRKLLVEDATDAGMLVAVSDDLGRLLWVEGARGVREQAMAFNFTEGARWSEDHAGTNAPGTALALDQPVQIFAAEHLTRPVTPWSCAAAPIHDPATGAVLGCLDVTGGDEAAAPATLSLVRATAAAVEAELRYQRLLAATSPTSPTSPTSTAKPRQAERGAGWFLELLGRPRAVLQRPGGPRNLSLRHSELLALLALHPEGQTGDQLALSLYEHDSATVSLRAELSRLRPVLEPVRLASRPYRLPDAVPTDVATVRRLVEQGRLRRAVEVYRGRLLPASSAPGIVALREALHEDLRAALLTGDDPEALLAFASAEHGLLDWQAWRTALDALRPGSPRRGQVERHLAHLDRELGTGAGSRAGPRIGLRAR